MKKIVLLLFVAIISFILYQLILGENGIVEKQRINQIKNELMVYKDLLEKKASEQDNFIKYLKTILNLTKICRKVWFFEDEYNFVKIIDPSGDKPNSDLYGTEDIIKISKL